MRICYQCRLSSRAGVGKCPNCGCVAFFHARNGRLVPPLAPSKALESLGDRTARDRSIEQQYMIALGAKLRGWAGLTARRHQRSRARAE